MDSKAASTIQETGIDLLTIFPSVRLETTSWENGKRKPDPNLQDHFFFNKSEIFSFSRLQSNPELLDDRRRTYVEELRPQLVDSEGEQLGDFTIVYDKRVNLEGLEVPNSDGQHILCYLALCENLDHYVSLDFIKIVCYSEGGRRIERNNMHELLTMKYKYVLHAQESYIYNKLTVSRQLEEVTLKSLEALAKEDFGFYRRVMTAITLFNESCRIHAFSANSAIVLITSAFEALLHIPRSPKKHSFSYAFKLFWGFNERVERWASDLYELRNRIVHGAVVESGQLYASEDRHYPHFKIARGIFNDSLLLILESKGFLRLDEGHRLEVMKQLWNKVISNKEKVRAILERKDRFTYEAFCRERKLYEEFLRRMESLTVVDYSAKESIKKLLDLVFSVMERWMSRESEKKQETSNEDFKRYLEYRNKRYEELVELLNAAKTIPWTLHGRFEVEKRLRSILDVLRELEPIWHRPDEFKFTLSEFGERCLRAVFGTY